MNMIEQLAWIILGCLAGIFTGLVPGIHINTISLFLLLFFDQSDLNLVLFIISLSLVHSFVDFIPSIILGAPSSDNFLAVLPGHKLLLKGYGYFAIKLTVLGGLLGGLFSLVLVPFYGLFLLQVKDWLGFFVPAVLGGTLFLLVLSEKTLRGKIYALVIVILSGLLGLIVLSEFSAVSNGLFVGITGLFGASTLVYSLKQRPIIKKQFFHHSNFPKLDALKFSLISTLAGLVVSTFPGVGASQAAFLVRQVKRKINSINYLIVLGGINTTNLLLSFFVLYFVGKTRTGAAAAVKQLLFLQPEHLLFFSAVILIGLGFGSIITLFLSKKFLRVLNKLDYLKINFIVLCLLLGLVCCLTNALGLLAFVTATAVGLISPALKLKRAYGMAFLMLPVIKLYLAF